MNTIPQYTGELKIDIETHHSDSESIPKQLQILGTDLSVKESYWMEGKTWKKELQPGVYLVRLNLASGKRLEEIAEISNGHETKLDFNIGKFSPKETQEWMYLTKGTAGENPVGNFRNHHKTIKFQEITTTRWVFEEGTWTSEPEKVLGNLIIDTVGESYQLYVPNAMHLLEIGRKGKPSTFICLPSSHSLDFMIKIAEDPNGVVGDLDISCSTKNKVAQVLLSLMNSGDINKGKSLFGAEDAERLLYQKMVDPVGAAIGGYFLLKTGELDRMHNWAQNLANRFQWMPDGAVIYGWQLIREDSKPENIKLIRTQLIEAINRGIPIYTEGLRLLYEGLMMLSFEFKHKDLPVENALARVKKYLNAADLSQENTSFTGFFPDLPRDRNPESSGMLRKVERINPN
ncbi:hypothetical protein [Cognataquiflexum aquatile]|uniref:hypothetical protein n=1 Tax=Cognataquiflexum aquatile TaxID=2249427 RepID=UPI000DEBB0D8|nr:hypothetical protein [Cognataquiflexum aquatile]